MNERIRSLLERAEYQAQKHPGPDWEVYVEPSREQILEKFAQLIVRECLTEVVDEVQYATSYELADQVANRVKKHFGVEE